MSVGPISRYNYAVLMRVVDTAGRAVEIPHLDIRPRLVSTISADAREYSPSKADNWSRISWRYLGTGRHWWVIADHSDVVDPFRDLSPHQNIQFLSQLSAAVLAGEQTQMTVNLPKKLSRGMSVTVESLDPAAPVSVTLSILTVDEDTGIVTFPPTTFPTGGVPTALSRISHRITAQVRLRIPAPSRVLFTSLDFSDPLNTLVE